MAKERAAEKSAELKEPKVKKLSAEDKVVKTSKKKDKKEKKEKKEKKHAKIEEELASKPEVEEKAKAKKADAKQAPVSPSKEPEVAPDYMSLDESEPEAPVSQTPKKKTSKKEARQNTSDPPKFVDKEAKTKKTSDPPKPKKASDEKEPKSKKYKDKKKSEENVEASKDEKKDDKKGAKKAEKKTPPPSVAEVKSTKDEENDDSSSDSDSEDGGAKVENTKGKSTNNTGPNRPARRRLMLIDRQKIKIQKRLGVEEGSTEPNEEVDKALEEWTKNFDELNAKSIKKQAAKAKKALKRRNDNHKRTTKGMTTKQLEKIHQRRAAKNQTKFAAHAA